MAVPNRSRGNQPHWFSADLVLVLGLAVLSFGFAAIPSVEAPLLRFLVAAGVVFLAPGYALVAALFPRGVGGRSSTDVRRLGGVERLVVGAGTSVAVVGLGGLALGILRVPLEPLVVVGTTSAFTVLAVGIAAARRRRLPASERYRVGLPVETLWSALSAVRSRPTGRAELLTVVVLVSVVVAAASVGVAMTQRPAGESFTELSVLTEDENGELIADDYPRELVRGESQSLVVAIGNRERQVQSYSVVVLLDGAERSELDRFSVDSVPAEETVTVERQLTPTRTGESLRLSFLLYRGSAPAEPTAESAYREVHLWVDVTE